MLDDDTPFAKPLFADEGDCEQAEHASAHPAPYSPTRVASVRAVTQSLPLLTVVSPPVMSSVAVRTPLPAVNFVGCLPPKPTSTASSFSASLSIRPPSAAAATPSSNVHARLLSPSPLLSLYRDGSPSWVLTLPICLLVWLPSPALSSLASPPLQLRDSPFTAAVFARGPCYSAASVIGRGAATFCPHRRSIRPRLPSRLRLTHRGTT